MNTVIRNLNTYNTALPADEVRDLLAPIGYTKRKMRRRKEKRVATRVLRMFPLTRNWYIEKRAVKRTTVSLGRTCLTSLKWNYLVVEK